VADHVGSAGAGAQSGELVNLIVLARALLASARAREESRGAHTRLEFPATEAAWRCRLVHAAVRGAPGAVAR